MSAARSTADGLRRVIVHMGVQKTGSTSLHDHLQAHEAALMPGLQALTPRRASPTRDMGRAALLYTDDPSPEAGRRARLIETIETVRDLIAPGPGVTLISHENLPGAMLGRAGTVTLYPFLEEIVSLLDTHLAPYRPEYVIYTRDLAAWKRSAHNQAVRSDGYTETLGTFLSRTADSGDWADLARRLTAAAPGRAHVLRLEDETDRARPGSQLLALAGLSPEEIAALVPQTTRRNESLNFGALEFLRLLNTLDLRPKQRRSVAQIVERNQQLFTPSAPADAPRPA
ncbi:MAG: hypothetical protein R3D85_13535 [Paracoccaceae bacterium]